MTYNLPSVIYHSLDEVAHREELVLVLDAACKVLDSGHVSSIVNAFFVNTKICVNGIPYIKVGGLAAILRTGNSGAERPLIYQGIPKVLSAAEIIEINGVEHISGPALRALIDARMILSTGRTKQYLRVAMQYYEKILSLSQVRDLKDVFLEDIRTRRPLLKTHRIEELNITSCEFTGAFINSRQEVEFAHIESVSTNPLLALKIENGVIILKKIHSDLTRKNIHGYEDMYKYCIANGYSTAWAD
jgi:hypothetical protein